MVTAIDLTQTGYRWPRNMLYFLGLTLATSSVVFIEPAPYDVLVIVLFGLALTLGMGFPRETQLAVIWLSIFVLANMVAAALSEDPATTIRFLGVRTYLVLTWFLFTSLIASNPARVLRAIWGGYTIAVLIALVWGAMEYFGFIRMEMWQGGLRAKGPFKDPNVFAPFLIPIAIYCIKQLYSNQKIAQKVCYAALFLFIAFGILIGFSRGGWVAFICSFVLFSMLVIVCQDSLRDRLKLILANMLLILMAFSVLSVAVMTTSIGERFFQRAVISQEYDLKEGGRFFTQQESIKIIGVTPLGIGPGRSRVELGLQPHNIYLHMFLESGWIGGIAFSGFLLYTLYLSLYLFRWQSPLRSDFLVVFSSLAGLLLQSLFIDSTHWRHFWLLLAMNWGFIIAYKRS